MASERLREAETIALKDGTVVTVRPIRPDDAQRLQAFHAGLSPETIYLRWLSAHPVLTETEAKALTHLDYAERMAFVAMLPGETGEEIVGVARYGVVGPDQSDEAEAAVVVQDAYQHRGLGSLLLLRLREYARAQGIRYWVAEINAENARMMKFIQRAVMPATKRLESGHWQIRMDISKADDS
ncbi:MAG: GNAT family N-acetyltransferase [Anaerolineales bacterium]|nr:GNAT family N-acetyltransferase [Anaerolineales bacterium]